MGLEIVVLVAAAAVVAAVVAYVLLGSKKQDGSRQGPASSTQEAPALAGKKVARAVVTAAAPAGTAGSTISRCGTPRRRRDARPAPAPVRSPGNHHAPSAPSRP